MSTAHPVSFATHRPAGPLADLVDLFWWWRGHDLPYSKERVLPAGTVELVISLDSPDGAGAISGPRSRSFVIERTARDELLGVHFKPGGAFPFLGFPAGELHNLDLLLTDLWGPRPAGELVGRLHEVSTVKAKFRVLERWLLRVADRPLAHHPAVGFALEGLRGGGLSSAGAAEKTGLSQRRFIELFRGEVGMTPKLYSRVQRFIGVVGSVSEPGKVDWSDVAAACGYFDQSHFIHEFQEFSGLTPTEYLRLRKPGAPLHVEIPESSQRVA